MTTPIVLKPGDVLLYSRHSFYNWLISIKTWSPYTHVEVVQDAMTAVASRNGQGVNRYPLDLSGLVMVLRPTVPFQAAPASAWMDTVQGQPYDWCGLLVFVYATRSGKENWAMFCSEFATRYLRRGGVPIFGTADADAISPRDFALSEVLTPVWKANKE